MTERPPQLIWLVGASAGIGAALARELSAAGYRLALSARRVEPLQALCRELGMAGTGIYPVDVTDERAVRACVAAIEQELGPIDCAIINAGDYHPMPLDAFDTALFRRLIDVNYLGVVHCLAALLPNLIPRRTGQILVTASVAGYRGLPQAAPYSASKAAAINLVESLQPELRSAGVNIRLINPGFVDTALTRKNRFAMPFLLQPEDAAKRIVSQLERQHFEIAFPRRFVWLMKILRCLPYRLYFPLVRRITNA